MSMYKQPIFNAGYRICLGKDMALTQIGVTLCILLKKFDFTMALPFDINIDSNITLYVKDGLMTRIDKIIDGYNDCEL